jgi:hypothetical protein
MGFLDAIQGLLKGGTRGFNGLERAVLTQASRALPQTLQRRWEQRIEAVNLVQRLDGGREVNCYVMKHGKPAFDDETRIDAAAGEKVLARFVVEGAPGTANSGNLWLINGNLFSIEFDRPTEHAVFDAVSAVRVQLTETKGDGSF